MIDFRGDRLLSVPSPSPAFIFACLAIFPVSGPSPRGIYGPLFHVCKSSSHWSFPLEIDNAFPVFLGEPGEILELDFPLRPELGRSTTFTRTSPRDVFTFFILLSEIRLFTSVPETYGVVSRRRSPVQDVEILLPRD